MCNTYQSNTQSNNMEDYEQENRNFPEDKILSRKSKKPLMEKRRRARINNCLVQLKSLVLQAMKKDTTHYSKLEKADILEMTVKYLRSLQRRQMTSAVAADPTVAAKYSMGFTECASEVARYLGNSQGINDEVRGRLLGHLSNCVQTGNSFTASGRRADLRTTIARSDSTSPERPVTCSLRRTPVPATGGVLIKLYIFIRVTGDRVLPDSSRQPLQ
nr:transcription factor HES-1 [Crassostrea gigas]